MSTRELDVALPRRFRARTVSLLSVGGLVASALFGLLAVLPARGLAQVTPAEGRLKGDGLAAFTVDDQQVPACTFVLRVASHDQPDDTFTCQMSDEAVALGIPFVSLTGAVDAFVELSEHAATVTGTSDLGLPDGGQLQDIPFRLSVLEGGPDQGALRIRLIGVFDGDT